MREKRKRMITNNKLYVDFHIIQTMPPSCVNRDDTGSPKTAVYGGVRRARISSQAWKKATRDLFKEILEKDKLAQRTKDMVGMVIEHIPNAGDIENLHDKVRDLINRASVKASKPLIPSNKKVETDDPIPNISSTTVLYFLGYYEAKELAKLVIRQENGEKIDREEVLLAMSAKKNGEHLQSLAVETALYGRLVTNQPVLNTDASCQVAHAISTHKVDTEFDYFTAIDDRSPEDSAGAGMIGTVEFNSSTLYRYATIAAHDLKKQLGGSSEAAEAVAKFAEAFITSMPTGKQNTFANRTVPDYVLITIRKDQPVNLVGAFEEPVKTFGGGFAKKSIEKMTNYAAIADKNFCDSPLEQFIIPGDKNLSETIELLKKKVGEEL
jgi:CRISPR system Cascade subunit CasC